MEQILLRCSEKLLNQVNHIALKSCCGALFHSHKFSVCRRQLRRDTEHFESSHDFDGDALFPQNFTTRGNGDLFHDLTQMNE